MLWYCLFPAVNIVLVEKDVKLAGGGACIPTDVRQKVGHWSGTNLRGGASWYFPSTEINPVLSKKCYILEMEPIGGADYSILDH